MHMYMRFVNVYVIIFVFVVPNTFLLIAQDSYINLISFDVPQEDIALPLPLSITGGVEYIAYDRRNNFVYWSQQTPPAIVRSRLDGIAHEVIINNSIALPVGVAVNNDGSTLYWVDAALDKIEVVSLGMTAHKRRVIVDTGLDHPKGIAINEGLGYV